MNEQLMTLENGYAVPAKSRFWICEGCEYKVKTTKTPPPCIYCKQAQLTAPEEIELGGNERSEPMDCWRENFWGTQ